MSVIGPETPQLVIGPLTKGAVTDLAHSGPLSIPVLALNQIPGTAPARLYQFALAPEDEAQQAAERASLDGHTQAFVIVPASDWGARQLQAFAERFKQLGGTVVRVERYGTPISGWGLNATPLAGTTRLVPGVSCCLAPRDGVGSC